MLALLLTSQALKARKEKPRQPRGVCSLCGEQAPEERLIERTFISGYRRAFCGRCAAELYQEANRQGLINHEHLDTRPIGSSKPGQGV